MRNNKVNMRKYNKLAHKMNELYDMMDRREVTRDNITQDQIDLVKESMTHQIAVLPAGFDANGNQLFRVQPEWVVLREGLDWAFATYTPDNKMVIQGFVVGEDNPYSRKCIFHTFNGGIRRDYSTIEELRDALEIHPREIGNIQGTPV